MTTATPDIARHPLATAGFVVDCLATIAALAFTVAWFGFAPVVLVSTAAAYLFGRRAGILSGGSTATPRRTAGTAILVVAGVALLLALIAWVGPRG